MATTDTNANLPGENAILEPTLDKPEIIAILDKECPGGKNAGEWLLFREHDLRVTVEFGEMTAANGMYSVQLLFIAKHPFFDEDLVESVVGVGPTPDDAIRIGAKNMAQEALVSVIRSFDSVAEPLPPTHIMGKEYRFHVPKTRGMLHIGQTEPTDLWELIEDKLPQYLGTKRCYWVSMFSACVNGIPQCEVRINGDVVNDLTDILLTDAIKHKDVKGYTADKMFVLITQDEETYTPCPYTKQDAGEATFRAMRLFQHIRDEETVRKYHSEILNICPARNLGIELVSFLPEIVAQQVVQFRDNDTLIPVVDRGKPEFELKKTQVRSYGYISDAVAQYLRKQNPPKEEINQILALSAKFHALSEAIEKGAKLEDLRMSQLVYFVDGAYQVW